MLVFVLRFFQCQSKRLIFNSAVTRIQIHLQCPRHTQTFGWCSMDYTPNKYLILVMSKNQMRLSILAKDTDTLAESGLEVTIL